MKKLSFNIQDGIDALCAMLPGLGQHDHTRSMRDAALKTAADLLRGEMVTAIMVFTTIKGEDADVAMVIAEQEAERDALMEELDGMSEPQKSAQVYSFPAPEGA